MNKATYAKYALAAIILAIGGYGFADEARPQVPKAWDPQLLQALPREAEQAMAAIPTQLRVLAEASYSFGSAVGPDGSLWFTTFGGELRRLTPGKDVETVSLGKGGDYGVAVDREGNVFIGFESDRASGGILRIAPDGQRSDIVRGETRPRQLTCDDVGNVYFVLESARQVRRWNREDGTLETIVDGLSCPQGVAVAPDGAVYYSEYGVFGAAGRALEPGSVHVRRPDGSTKELAKGFWRARGLARDSEGNLYVTSEANAWDQGNSGALFKIKPSGDVECVVPGLDYPQFPAVDAEGRVYFTLCRDRALVVFDPKAACSTSKWPGDPPVEVGVCGGRWQPGPATEGAVRLEVQIEEVILAGNAFPEQAGEIMRVWVRVPADLMKLDPQPLPYPSREVPVPGVFELPEVRCVGAERVFTLPVRRHVCARWPVHHNASGVELAADGFDESPEAFLVYLDFLAPEGK